MKQAINAENIAPDYKGLYRLGGVAAVMVAVLTLGEIVAFALYPQPGTVSGWFALFQNNRMLGLLDFWGLEVPMYAMFAIVFPALFLLLRRAGESRMVVALVLALLGVAVFFATNNPFTMLSLSDQYAAATTDAHRSSLLAAGQAVLTNTGQRAIGGFNMGLFLVSLAGLIVAWVMLRSSSFSRFAAWIGIAANGLSLADYLRAALTSSAVIALLVILPGALCLMIWFVLTGLRLYRLGSVEREAIPTGAESRAA